uniref:Uncharacterized protein n=1 Tax=Cacopsylla melanoneura TaxID=428564 RepID=A0A8D8LYS6_9HEMI
MLVFFLFFSFLMEFQISLIFVLLFKLLQKVCQAFLLLVLQYFLNFASLFVYSRKFSMVGDDLYLLRLDFLSCSNFAHPSFHQGLRNFSFSLKVDTLGIDFSQAFSRSSVSFL